MGGLILHWHRNLVALSLVVVLVSSAVMVGGGTSTSGEVQQPSRIFNVAKPAVVIILTEMSAEVSIPTPMLDEENADELFDKLQRQGIESFEEAFPLIAEAFADDPLRYWVPDFSAPLLPVTDASSAIMGTGFLVSPDGYIVTNAHVAAPSEEEIKSNLAADDSTMDAVMDAMIAAIPEPESLLALGEECPECLDNILFSLLIFSISYMEIGDPTVEIFSYSGVTVPGVVTGPKGFVTELIDHGESAPGKDIAILKMEGSNLPTVSLGDDTDMSVGDSMYVIGFPGAATFHPALAEESIVEASLTSGLLSAKKTMPGGWRVLQTDADITHGNSGGPVFDSSGNVVGIATFGTADPITGTELAGFNFVVPSTILNQFLKRNNIEPEESLFTKLWGQGLDAYDRGSYKKALELFQQANALQPSIPIVLEFTAKAQEKALEIPPEPPSNGGDDCLIATAAFGSELTPQVQFLRDFRDNHILSTTAGSSFMNVFNAWYYSFSPYVADYEREQPWLQQTVKTAIYPLLGILQTSEKAYSSIDGEYGALAAGVIASSMIGAVYFWPFALSIRRVRTGRFNYKLAISVLTITSAAVVGAMVAGNEYALMTTTSLFVLALLSISAVLFSKFIIVSIKRFLSILTEPSPASH